MFELAKETLHQIALTVNAPVYGAMGQALTGGRYVGFGSTGPDQIGQGIGVIVPVGDDMVEL